MKATSIIIDRSALTERQQTFMLNAENRGWQILVTAYDTKHIVLTTIPTTQEE